MPSRNPMTNQNRIAKIIIFEFCPKINTVGKNKIHPNTKHKIPIELQLVKTTNS